MPSKGLFTSCSHYLDQNSEQRQSALASLGYRSFSVAPDAEQSVLRRRRSRSPARSSAWTQSALAGDILKQGRQKVDLLAGGHFAAFVTVGDDGVAIGAIAQTS